MVNHNIRRVSMKKIIILMSVLILTLLPATCFSKTFAYLFAPNEINKLDTDTDTIVSSQKSKTDLEGRLDFKDAGCAVDINNKYLITLYEPDRSGSEERPGFFVYDLGTLDKIKFVPFPEIIKDPAMMSKIIYPQAGTKYYIQIDDSMLNNGQGGIINLAYEKKTHNYLGVVNNILNQIREKFWFSKDHINIYVETEESNIRIYDSQTLQISSAIDLSNVYAKSVWGKSIDDIRNSIALLGENNKLKDSDKNNISFLTYSIIDATTTPRVITGMEIETLLLTPDAKKIVFNETKSLIFGQKAPKKTASATGHIYIYMMLKLGIELV
jgi:hypothetical protein